MQSIRSTAALIAAFFIAITLSACGDSAAGPSASSPPATAEPPPSRIVSLSASATEMLFAIGAGEQVVAVDDQSNFPPAAPTTSLSAYKPNVEAIAGYDPDLVVIASDSGELAENLEALDLRVLKAPAARTLDDTYHQLAELGRITGHESEASKVAGDMKRRLQELTGSVPESMKGATYYHELDPNYFTATSKTFIGEVYSLLGLRNIADEADVDASGYPQLSAEFIVRADPDLIFLADTKCCAQSPETVRARDGWASLRAVRTGGVIALDDDIASRWGPRVVDFVEAVVDRLGGIEKAA